jgi:uncharacterized protein YkwD
VPGQDDAVPGQDDAVPGQDDAVPGQDDAGVPQQAAQLASQQDGGQDDTPHRPGGTAASTSDDHAAALADNRGHTADHGRGQADGGRGNAGDAADDSRTAGHARPVTQKAATTLAAAQRDVSPASVSTNPAALVQQQVLSLVNQNRRRGGCDDLSLDRRLIDAAYDHAVDMARRGYFAHESPNGDGAGDRVSEAGYRWRRYGENIARGQESAYEVVDGWMHSPEHRENIMDCRLHQMGIGLAFSPDRTPYWVQDFASPR